MKQLKKSSELQTSFPEFLCRLCEHVVNLLKINEHLPRVFKTYKPYNWASPSSINHVQMKLLIHP